jgi:hypothetical protein
LFDGGIRDFKGLTEYSVSCVGEIIICAGVNTWAKNLVLVVMMLNIIQVRYFFLARIAGS